MQTFSYSLHITTHCIYNQQYYSQTPLDSLSIFSYSHFPLYSLSQQEILFFFGKDIPYEHHFCHFTYTQNTATGKLSKYPFTLRFNCQKGKITFTGSIDYLSNNSIGKISITIFDIKDTTQINIAVKDGQLRIIKIEHSDKKTYMQTLYNYNSK